MSPKAKNVNSNLKLTSVKLHVDLKDNFQSLTVNTDFTLQKLINRSMHLFNTDPNFRNLIKTHHDLIPSGSSL